MKISLREGAPATGSRETRRAGGRGEGRFLRGGLGRRRLSPAVKGRFGLLTTLTGVAAANEGVVVGAYKSQTRNTSCRSINNPAGAPPPLSPDAACTYMHAGAVYVCVCARARAGVRVCARVYPLSHGGVVIRRCPSCSRRTGVGATKRHVAEKERGGGGRSYEGGKSRAHFIIYVSTLAGEGRNRHIRSLHSRAREKRKEQKREREPRTNGRTDGYGDTPPARTHTLTQLHRRATCGHARTHAHTHIHRATHM